MTEVILTGPDGRIEARYHQADQKNAPAALILHPHPQHGGTMNNKVVYTLYRAFADQGFSVLRFNFRGVGRSQGKFDNGIGELCDAAAALDWLQLQNPDSLSFWVGGFSFGSWIAMQLLMRRPEIEGFVTIAPPASMYDFSFLAPCPSPGLIVQGDEDSIVPEEAATKLVTRLNNQKNIKVDYHVVKGADHFFRNKLDQLSLTCNDYIKTNLMNLRGKPRIRPDRRRRQLPRS